MERQQYVRSVGVEGRRSALQTSRQFLSTALAQMSRWRQLSKDRAELARMSDDRLRDIGLSRADVLKESSRPFWDDPMRR
ncbi:DUF1127 domain-containing protein [Pseudomonas fluorescens]|uniref:YjiS-like domain-containing protein n=1 Tax=Pseudomonas fluorescens TaxID=294 RepID=A0A5E7E696_PSEFL|nr:DUF1127 domain-containing protein [Pseudomonas fluorescens]VVO22192.1 hypothetical protein PS691_04274 [Pseudomonas fluorescens]